MASTGPLDGQHPKSRHSIITIPVELCHMILYNLSSDDIISLRLVSRQFLWYFSDNHICEVAHKLYFPTPFHRQRLRPPEPGSQHNRATFDAVYTRNRRWKTGSPSAVHTILDVADSAAGPRHGFIVDRDCDVLAYQQSRGVIILKDLGADFNKCPDVTLDLNALLGDCIMGRTDDIHLRDGESIRMHANRGVLLVVGEAHPHVVVRAPAPAPAPPASLWESIVQWWLPPQPPLRAQRILAPHTLCAVFSLKHERGKLLHQWVELDSFLSETALNEYYAISEFDIREQRLNGYIFPTTGSEAEGPSQVSHPGHHFVIRKKTLYPQLFTMCADTQGKVFFLAFISPHAARRPVVEVCAVPSFDPETSEWSQTTVLKRVVLRSLLRNIGAQSGFSPGYWIEFEEVTTAGLVGYTADEKRRRRGVGEDMVRLKLRGDFLLSDLTLNMVTWDITARPSPLKPSTVTEWDRGIDWAPGEYNEEGSKSPYAAANGIIDLDEVYPKPTYYAFERNRELFCNFKPVGNMDLDREGAAGDLARCAPPVWTKDEEGRYKTLHVLYNSSRYPNDHLRKCVIGPGPSGECRIVARGEALAFDGSSDGEEDATSTVSTDSTYISAYPSIPGIDDDRFIPRGELLNHHQCALSWCAGSTAKLLDIPAPGFNREKKVLTAIDHDSCRYVVYGKQKGGSGSRDAIVILRFD